MTPVPRVAAFTGPAVLSYGFRPFFLVGALWAGLTVLLWLPVYEGRIGLDGVFTPTDWHAHELLFGYVAAVVTGFLLTAIPNWTGRLPLAGLPLGFTMGPEDLILEADGSPVRIDKAYSWEAPVASHGLMHMVITNAWKGDPYPIDTLFMYMANMSWNSTMNTKGVMEMLTDKDPATGEYRIPRIIYSDAYASEMVAYADLVLPDTTYLERWDCISLLDRPICEADGPADAIRQPEIGRASCRERV